MLKYENAKSKKYGNSQLSMKLWKFIQKSNYRNMETQPTAEARKSKKYGNLLKSINIDDISRDVEAVIFQTLPLPHLSLPLPPLPLPLTKNKKRSLTIFFNFCGSVACLLLHFIILRKEKPSFIAITLPTSLELIISNYSVFLFLRYQNSC